MARRPTRAAAHRAHRLGGARQAARPAACIAPASVEAHAMRMHSAKAVRVQFTHNVNAQSARTAHTARTARTARMRCATGSESMLVAEPRLVGGAQRQGACVEDAHLEPARVVDVDVPCVRLVGEQP